MLIHEHKASDSADTLFKAELLAHLFDGTPLHQYALLSAPRSGQEPNRTRRHATTAGKKSAQLLVGRAVGGRRRHANFHGLPMETCAFSAGGFWLDMNRNGDAFRCAANGLFPLRGLVLSHGVAAGH